MNLNLEAGLLAKIGAGVAGAAGVTGVGVGGCYAAGVLGAPKINYRKLDDTDWSTVRTQKDKYGVQTIGDVYGRYLFSPYSNEKNKTKHEKEWKDKFDSFTSTSNSSTPHAFFSKTNATTAYQPQGTTQSKGLNQLCEEAYKKPASEVSFLSSGNQDHQILGSSLLYYCSPLGAKPSDISNYAGTYGENSIARKKSKILVKTEDTNEKYFWEAQEKWFISLGDQVTDPYFVEYIKQGSGKNSEFLKEACEKAYNLPSDTVKATKEKPLMEDVVKYCSFPGYSNSH